MNKRLFVFGCSFTNYNSPTWADCIAPHFDQFYNFGRGGISNTLILHRLLAADAEFKFQVDDHVVVMLTGFNRFSWLANDGQDWHTHGDLDTWVESQDAQENLPWVRSFRDRMWSARMAVEQSWVAVQAIKQLLINRDCGHDLIMGLDNSHYVSHSDLLGLTALDVQRVREIYDLLDHKESLDQFRIRRGFSTKDHPNMEQHQAFVQQVFPSWS